jgi:hypothetical protein
VLQAFDRSEEGHTPLQTEPAGAPLLDEEFRGDDLLVRRDGPSAVPGE